VNSNKEKMICPIFPNYPIFNAAVDANPERKPKIQMLVQNLEK
jgi:histidinol phosphatase-like enzyme